MGRMLAKLCEGEVREGRPMLGSVVVRKDRGIPGGGYFREAQRLRGVSMCTDAQRRAFWAQEVERVYQYWSEH